MTPSRLDNSSSSVLRGILQNDGFLGEGASLLLLLHPTTGLYRVTNCLRSGQAHLSPLFVKTAVLGGPSKGTGGGDEIWWPAGATGRQQFVVERSCCFGFSWPGRGNGWEMRWQFWRLSPAPPPFTSFPLLDNKVRWACSTRSWSLVQ